MCVFVQSLSSLQQLLKAAAANENGAGVKLCDPDDDDGLQCHVERLSAGCRSSEQPPFIYFINTLSSVTSSWLKNTHTRNWTHIWSSLPLSLCLNSHKLTFVSHTYTHTHTLPESCSTSRALRKPSCFVASDYRLPTPPFKFITNYWSSTKKKKRKKREEKAPLLIPMATALDFPCSAQSIRQRLGAVLSRPGWRGEVQGPEITLRGWVCPPSFHVFYLISNKQNIYYKTSTFKTSSPFCWLNADTLSIWYVYIYYVFMFQLLPLAIWNI